MIWPSLQATLIDSFPSQRERASESAEAAADDCCAYCGSASDVVTQPKIPRDFGGSDAPSNLEAVCRVCRPMIEQITRSVVDRSRAQRPGRRFRRQPS